MDETDYTPPKKLLRTKWERVFAWKPVEIDGETYWLTHVYRRYVGFDTETTAGTMFQRLDNNVGTAVVYGTLFDVIKGD